MARWVSRCASAGVKLPADIQRMYVKRIRAMLAEGFPARLIESALSTMLADRVANRPGLLPHRLVEVQARGGRKSTTELVRMVVTRRES